jgi:NADH dehydrogenase/NADH:ubiquinone oxidoreductase subunit G
MTAATVGLEIDGRAVTVPADATVLGAAQAAGIEVPTLCWHEKVAVYGGCRLCVVEVEGRAGPRLVVACGYPVAEGLRVRTRSPRVDRTRRTILELTAPLVTDDACLKGKLRRFAEEYGADAGRFAAGAVPNPTGCTLCGLCVHTCAEVVGAQAIGFAGRGMDRQVVYFPDAGCEYRSCKKCFSVCFTGKIAREAAATVFPGASIREWLAAHGVAVHSLRAFMERRR